MDMKAEAERVSKWFADHQIINSGERFWTLAKCINGEWESPYLTTIFCPPYSPQLVCVGDCDPVVFAFGPREPAQRVNWIAKGNLGYVATKAHIGGTRRVWEFNVEAAIQELKDHLAEYEPDEDHTEKIESIVSQCMDNDSEDLFYRELWESNLFEDADFPEFGRRIGINVFCAHAAVKALKKLLDGGAT